MGFMCSSDGDKDFLETGMDAEDSEEWQHQISGLLEPRRLFTVDDKRNWLLCLPQAGWVCAESPQIQGRDEAVLRTFCLLLPSLLKAAAA